MKISFSKTLLGIASLTALLFQSCKKDEVFGDIDENTKRPVVEFTDGRTGGNVNMEYSDQIVEFDLTELRFMTRSYITSNATVKLIDMPGAVYDYNDVNGTSLQAVSPANYALVPGNEITLTPDQRKLMLRVKLRPSQIASGSWAIGLAIASINGAEISGIKPAVVVRVAVKNKYDGIYHLRGHFTRTDNPAYNGPFETEVHMITTGPSSVVMYWPLADDYGQPFSNAGSLSYFINVAPEVFFNANDQVTSLTNYTGDPATGPFMTPFPGADSRYDESGADPTIYLKYYYNPDPTNRILADTLTYIGPR